MLEQRYSYGVFVFDRDTEPMYQIIDRVFFTVRGRTQKALDRAAERHLKKVQRSLNGGEYIDDVMWDDPHPAAEEDAA